MTALEAACAGGRESAIHWALNPPAIGPVATGCCYRLAARAAREAIGGLKPPATPADAPNIVRQCAPFATAIRYRLPTGQARIGHIIGHFTLRMLAERVRFELTGLSSSGFQVCVEVFAGVRS